MVIQHNLAAMNSSRMFNITNKKKASSTEKLSSGYKINRAADDAAGLAISEKMRRQIRGLTQGVENTQAGVSLCQVADGALAEVDEMLHRITELSVKSANDTNSKEDREFIQEEVKHLLEEIDRIGDTTTFNEQPIFKGVDNVIRNEDGTVATHGSLAFGDFTLTDVDLGKTPIRARENADKLHFEAIVNKSTSVLDGRVFNLIYGSGSTSDSSLRITDSSNNQTIIEMDSLAATNFTSNGTNEWSRDFVYSSGDGKDVTITQKVKVDESSSSEKKYIVSYDFTKSADVANVEFMFHVDTAYNDNDLCEGYFINGNRVENFCVYNQDAAGSNLTNGSNPSSYIYNGTVPDSLSIVDVDHALAFSEKISFGSRKPDSLSIGHYGEIRDWNYYDSLDNSLGRNANKKDLGFCLYYDLGDLSQESSLSFDYGIVDVQTDPNLNNVPINKDTRPIVDHESKKSLWIQSGSEAGVGMYVTIDEMNTSVLGIRGLDVSTVAGASHALDAVKGALHEVSSIRSTIGAQQNRLEHTIANEENIIENTTAAESQIRDTDMAKEMVMFSNLNILEQAGYSMMAQANQDSQRVLSLLQ